MSTPQLMSLMLSQLSSFQPDPVLPESKPVKYKAPTLIGLPADAFVQDYPDTTDPGEVLTYQVTQIGTVFLGRRHVHDVLADKTMTWINPNSYVDETLAETPYLTRISAGHTG